MQTNKPLILASASPRRKELFSRITKNFTIAVATGEEESTQTDPASYALELSDQKAKEIAQKKKAEAAYIIGADTIVSYEGTILGKPADAADAFSMLRMLSGNTHQVFTGITIYETGADVEGSLHCLTQFADKTDVTFYPLSDAQINAYIATGEPMDKAGSYGIQGQGGLFVKSICGDFYNVVGLPMARLARFLSEHCINHTD